MIDFTSFKASTGKYLENNKKNTKKIPIVPIYTQYQCGLGNAYSMKMEGSHGEVK